MVNTRQNYPCGTVELAREDVARLCRTENPHRAVMGTKNHGLPSPGRTWRNFSGAAAVNGVTKCPWPPDGWGGIRPLSENSGMSHVTIIHVYKNSYKQ